MTDIRRSVASDRIWSSAAYSRAIRIGDVIEVAGTSSSSPSGAVLFAGDMYGQTNAALKIIADAIEELGGAIGDVVRTRIFLTDISLWEAAAKAHGDMFGHLRHPPTSAIYGIQALLNPGLMVEIEATAVILPDSNPTILTGN